MSASNEQPKNRNQSAFLKANTTTDTEFEHCDIEEAEVQRTPLTVAERKQKSRAAQDVAKKDEEKIKACERMRKKRAERAETKPKPNPMTPAERKRASRLAKSIKEPKIKIQGNKKEDEPVKQLVQKDISEKYRYTIHDLRENNRACMESYRAVQSEEEKNIEREKLRARMKNYRVSRTEEEIEEEKEKRRSYMAKVRENRSEAEILEEKEKKRTCMAKVRKNKSVEEIEEEKEKKRTYMAKVRENKSVEEIEEEKEKKQSYMATVRETQSEEVKMYAKIEKKQKMREVRLRQSGKSRQISNLKAKKGMKIFHEEGRLVDFERRDRATYNKQLKIDKELEEWNRFSQKGESHAKMLEQEKPDVVSRLNEAWREKRERDDIIKKEIEKNQKAQKDRANYSFDNFHYDAPTKGECEAFSKKRDEDYKVFFENLKKEKKEEEKRTLNAPLDALPERPLSEYEKIRENNIKEREDAMKEAGFFPDLSSYKSSVGFIKTDKH